MKPFMALAMTIAYGARGHVHTGALNKVEDSIIDGEYKDLPSPKLKRVKHKRNKKTGY